MSEPSAEPGRALVPMDAARGARVGVDDSRRAPKGERRGYSRATFPGLDAGQAVRTLRRLWWLPLLTALLAGTGAVLWVRQQPVSYSSRATLQLVEGRSGLSAGIAGQERRSQSSEVMIGSQLRIVRSRSIAAAVVDSEPLEFRVMPVDFPQSIIADVRLDSAALPARFPVYFAADGWRHDSAETGLTPYGVPGRIGPLRLTFSKPANGLTKGTILVASQSDAVDKFLRQLQSSEIEKTNLMELRLLAGDPRVAVGALESLVNTYQRVDESTAKQQARSRRVFIEEQLRQINAQVGDAERTRGTFRGNRQLYTAEDRLRAKGLELSGLESRRQELLTEQRLSADVRSGLESDDPAARTRALRLLPATPMGTSPAVSTVLEELGTRETARTELISGPRGLSASSAEVQRADTLVAVAQRKLRAAVQAFDEVLSARLASVGEQIAMIQEGLKQNPGTLAEDALLSQSADALKEQSAELRAEYQRARVAEAAVVGLVEVVDPPQRATALATPVARVGFFAMVFGLLFGTGIALARELLDHSLRSRAAVEQGLGVTLMAMVPRIAPNMGQRRALWPAQWFAKSEWRAGESKKVALAMASEPRSAHAEAFRQLRTHVSYALQAGRSKTVLVTSTHANEGKTSVSVNLAVAFAQQRLRVLLIDCDLVRPRLASLLGMPESPGVQQVLLEGLNPHSAIQETKLPGISLLPAGYAHTSALDAAGSLRFRSLLRRMSATYDVVILDTAPILAVADTVAMSVSADGVLLVTRAGTTRADEVEEAIRHLETVNATLLGVVLNDADGMLPGLGMPYYSYTAASKA